MERCRPKGGTGGGDPRFPPHSCQKNVGGELSHAPLSFQLADRDARLPAYGVSRTAIKVSYSSPAMVRGASDAAIPASPNKRNHVARGNKPSRCTSWTGRTVPSGLRRRKA